MKIVLMNGYISFGNYTKPKVHLLYHQFLGLKNIDQMIYKI